MNLGILLFNLDDNRFHLRILLQGFLTKLLAKAGLLESPKGSLGGTRIPTVDPDAAPSDVVSDSHRLVDVIRHDPRSKTVHGRIGSLDDLMHVLELDQALHRAKDLIRGNLHVVGDVRENGRLDEEAFVSDTRSAGLELGALLLAELDVAENLLELGVINLGSLLGPWGEHVPHDPAGGRRLALLKELVLDGLLDERP